MRVLYIADCLYMDMNGGRQSATAHLKTLKKIVGEDNVTVIALTGKKRVSEKKIITLSGYKNLIALFLNSLLGYTTFTNKKIENTIINQYLSDEYDVVFIDNSFYGSLAEKIKAKYPNIKIISYYHDVKQSLCREWMKKSSIIKKPLYKAMMKNERINQNICDINLTLNKRESDLFKFYYDKYPTGELGVYLHIDSLFNKDETIVGSKELEILFVGAYYYPNVSGILWFINQVMPLLNTKVKLTVVGNGMEKIKEDNDIPNDVKVVGWVESLSEYYEKADVVIAPIFEGGGMKVKTAEALGYGKAIVGTRESFEGYIENITPEILNNMVYLCNDKKEFAIAIDDINNKRKVKKYNAEIRSIFEEYYSSESAEKIIKRFLYM